MTDEQPVRFECAGSELYGIFHTAEPTVARGVVIVVGGPQYRVGSHRQFVLLARALARAGVPVLRFDYRGMGDSEGDERSFESVGPDIRAAVDELFRWAPGVREIVLWGLCDAASAALQYAPTDARVAGLVLLNPWVRTEQGLAKAYVKHYYLRRAFDPNLWRRLWARETRPLPALLSFLANLRESISRGSDQAPKQSDVAPLPRRMLDALVGYRGRVLIILSGDDITAGEFKELVAGSPGWRKTLSGARVTRRELADANHTFASRVWRDQVAAWTSEWLHSW